MEDTEILVTHHLISCDDKHLFFLPNEEHVSYTLTIDDVIELSAIRKWEDLIKTAKRLGSLGRHNNYSNEDFAEPSLGTSGNSVFNDNDLQTSKQFLSSFRDKSHYVTDTLGSWLRLIMKASLLLQYLAIAQGSREASAILDSTDSVSTDKYGHLWFYRMPQLIIQSLDGATSIGVKRRGKPRKVAWLIDGDDPDVFESEIRDDPNVGEFVEDKAYYFVIRAASSAVPIADIAGKVLALYLDSLDNYPHYYHRVVYNRGEFTNIKEWHVSIDNAVDFALKNFILSGGKVGTCPICGNTFRKGSSRGIERIYCSNRSCNTKATNERKERAKALAIQGIPIKQAIEIIGVKYASSIRRWYSEIEKYLATDNRA